jgi:pimeloyl-ACP methyl ester carboxylesterase
MPYIDAAGVKLYFEETGQGYPIIFVHEFGSDFRMWDAQLRHFSRGYRCIAYNARGYPPSDVPDDPALYGWEAAVDDIGVIMRGLEIERAHLVGSSMGAYAALQFGRLYPERTSAIVAAAAGSGCSPSQRDAWMKQTPTLARSIIDRGMIVMAERIAHSATRIQLKCKDPKTWQDFVDRLSQHSVQGMSTTIVRYQMLRPSLHDFREEFSDLTTPVFLAVGDEDKSCLETNLMLKSTLPGAGLWICPNAGHTINLEEPTAFNAQVESFLSAVERGSWRRDYPAMRKDDRNFDAGRVDARSPVTLRVHG